jgi:hypothetical protein
MQAEPTKIKPMCGFTDSPACIPRHSLFGMDFNFNMVWILILIWSINRTEWTKELHFLDFCSEKIKNVEDTQLRDATRPI